MGATSYPGMTQPFSMTHGSNMGSVGVRQDTMGELFLFIFLLYIKKKVISYINMYPSMKCAKRHFISFRHFSVYVALHSSSSNSLFDLKKYLLGYKWKKKEIKISPLSKTNHPLGNTFSNLNCHRIDNNKNYILYTILKAHLIFYPTNFLFYHIFIPEQKQKKNEKRRKWEKKIKWKKKKNQFEHCHIPSGISSHGIENIRENSISWFILHGLRL